MSQVIKFTDKCYKFNNTKICKIIENNKYSRTEYEVIKKILKIGGGKQNNIVEIFGTGRDLICEGIKIPKNFYTVKLYQNDLYEKILKSKKKPDKTFVLRLMIQMLQALDFLHDLYIIHNDIKEENIYVCGKNFLLADFDSCTSIENSLYYLKSPRDAQYTNGTEPYMSIKALKLTSTNYFSDIEVLMYLYYNIAKKFYVKEPGIEKKIKFMKKLEQTFLADISQDYFRERSLKSFYRKPNYKKYIYIFQKQLL